MFVLARNNTDVLNEVARGLFYIALGDKFWMTRNIALNGAFRTRKWCPIYSAARLEFECKGIADRLTFMF